MYFNLLLFAIRELRIANSSATIKPYKLLRRFTMLKPQDIVLLVKLLAIMNAAFYKGNPAANQGWSQGKLALHLCISVSEVNAGLQRLVLSGLLTTILNDDSEHKTKNKIFIPIRAACEECLISGVKYFFPVTLGAYTRGIATSYAAPILEKQFILGNNPIPVWPCIEGDKLGLALEPLYSSVPNSLSQYPDSEFYALLACVDAIRSGRARERQLAITLLREKLMHESSSPPSSCTTKLELGDVSVNSEKARRVK